MSNYTPLTNFGAKDTLPSGNAAKVVRGSEFTAEFNSIASSIATKAEVNAPSFTSDATFGGNIIVSGTVDGRDVAADGTKLDTIETSATADQTDAEIKTAYENNSNTNAFTDAEQSKLTSIEANADVTDTASVTAAGAAMLTGAAFTGDISLDTDAVFLSDLHDIGGKGRIGIGTNNPVSNLDIVADNGGTIRLSSDDDKTNIIAFKDNDSGNTNVLIKAFNESNHNTNDAGFLKLESLEGGSTRNIFEMRPNFTHSNRPIHSGYASVGDNVFSFASSTHGTFIGTPSSVLTEAGFATVLFGQETFGGANEYFDGILSTGLVESQNGYQKQGSIRADGEGAIALYAAHQNKGVKYQDSVFEPCATTTVSNGAGGTFTRYLQGTISSIDLGRSTNRWNNIYLANNPNVSSDQRLKENIEDADDAGSTIDAMQVRKFDWIEDGRHQSYGMIAQELAEVYPEAVSVSENEEDTLGIAYGDLIPMLIKEVQSLRSRVAELESE